MSHKAEFERWYNGVTEAERVELTAIKDKESEIEERFYAPLSFGTAGMRGEVGLGTYRMNVYTVRRATAGLAEYIKSLGGAEKTRGVVISYDTRRYSKEFAAAAAEVLSYNKIRTYLFENVRPVPVCSYAVRKFNAIAGIMITASHNPKEYNGYKVYGEDGAQMSPEATAVVVKYIDLIKDYFSVPYEKINGINDIENLNDVPLNEYVRVIGKALDESYYDEIEKLCLSRDIIEKEGKNVKLVYTPVHGAGYVPVTDMFKRLGINASVVQEQCIPDTEFSTVKVPNPENPETLTLGVKLGNEIGADVVLATDPDCDRLGVAVRNDKHEFILLTGNQIGVLLLDYILNRLKETGKLPNNGAVVRSFVTTTLADKICAEFLVKPFVVLTGFKYIGEKIKEWEHNENYKFIFGFEESYGYLRGTHARDKDAVVASMLFAEMLIYLESIGSGVYKRLNDIYDKYGYFAEINESVAYKGISGMSDMSAVMAALRSKEIKTLNNEKIIYKADFKTGIKKYCDGAEETLDFPYTDAVYFSLPDNQFVCIRPSGTEPKLKLYALASSDSEASARKAAHTLLNAIKGELK